ncbi:MAG: hypothetical protein EPO02_03700 [Nitrospirae bacterium]|nr:MAG: hypothetical protein EPO02_03700 [Nitrospirota bacterium]
MRTGNVNRLPAILIAITLLFCTASAAVADEDVWQLARKASCPELIEAYKATVAAEQEVVAAIKDSRNGTVATNVLGVATLAIVGFGFFTWNDNESAEENLADLRNDLTIIKTVASEKKCELPVIP